MAINTPIDDLYRESEYLTHLATLGAKIALQEAGLIKTTITFAEIKKLYGPVIANEARSHFKIKWMPCGKGGTTSGVYCLRTEFETFLFVRQFDFNRK